MSFVLVHDTMTLALLSRFINTSLPTYHIYADDPNPFRNATPSYPTTCNPIFPGSDTRGFTPGHCLNLLDPSSSSQDSSSTKRARFFVQFVEAFPARVSPATPVLPPMPITIDNGLLHLTLSLGSSPDSNPSLCGLMDTCGALNTGFLPFHQWVMSERPDVVPEYLEFDASNPFEPSNLVAPSKTLLTSINPITATSPLSFDTTHLTPIRMVLKLLYPSLWDQM
jgi:hypothetical protein